MSDPVLAAIIAASATIFTALLQLKAAFAREVAARAQGGPSRRKSRAPIYLIVIMLGAAGVGGYALARWAGEDERAEHMALQQELQARITEVSRTASQVEEMRNGQRAEIEAGVLRRLGAEGAAVTATVPPCKVASPAGAVELPSDVPATMPPPACTEADASPVTLCVSIPASATVAEVAVYVRRPDSELPWSASRVTPGEDVDRARFSEQPTESPDGETMRQICQQFVNWATDQSRVARLVVRYSPEPRGATASSLRTSAGPS